VEAVASVNRSGKQYLTFMLSGEEYGIDILTVQELRGWEETTPIPNSPSFVLGVINLRGVVIPVIDLRERFALERIEYGATTVVIIVNIQIGGKERVLGIVVDAFAEVYDIGTYDMHPPPDMDGAISIDFVTGLATMNEKMVILLDLNKLITEGVLAAGNKPKHNECEK